MKKTIVTLLVLSSAIIFASFYTKQDQPEEKNEPQKAALSSETRECLACHNYLHPGLVASWEKSRHAKVSPAMGLEKKKKERRISNEEIPETLKNNAIGCYECHSLNTADHADSFEHNGYQINIVVSSKDCETCHTVEAAQYAKNLMSHAYGNLVNNAVYEDFRNTINHSLIYEDNTLKTKKSHAMTTYESCLYCHGTKLSVTGKTTRETDFGEMEFPVIEGWPNQGVGRINPDGSKGACTSCHPRHDFSIETARKPYTCSECHKGPDVPAFKVYEVSKHGNIFSSKNKEFSFTNVPWIIGQDFTAPTCAACHASLIYDVDGNKIADRTHQFNDRLAWRLFGVPYAHAHPIDPDVSKIKNSAGLQLATELNSEPVSEFLISETEQEKRNAKMQQVCKSCHGTSWVEEHFLRLDNTIKTSNGITLTATQIMMEIWEKGHARGLADSESIFDEAIEKDWTSVWLFYANSVRFTSAMGGGGDYGVFANGRYQLNEKIVEMEEWLEMHNKIYKKRK